MEGVRAGTGVACNGDGVSVWGAERVLGLDDGDGCTAMHVSHG